ncbi:MAG: glutathione S-transferase family protein [Pseudomonadota bacterium]
MTLRIYGDSKSGNCLKIKWTAALLRRPSEWIETDIMKGESRTPAFLAMNPAGQVPVVLLPDGRPLAQSNAIMLHLADGSALIPADPYARAKMFEWLFWEQYSHEPTIAVARFRVRYLQQPVASLDPKLVERGHAALQRLDDALTGGGYLVPGALTLADIALVAYTRVAHEGGFDLQAYPHVLAWVRRIEADLNIGAAA